MVIKLLIKRAMRFGNRLLRLLREFSVDTYLNKLLILVSIYLQ